MEISKRKQSLLTTDYLRSRLSYDPATGVFTWISTNTNRIKLGGIAGCINKIKGYRYIGIALGGKKKLFLAHRLAWLYVYGIWPKTGIDHIDRDRDNNRISNLREATAKENQYNRKKKKSKCTSQYMGVCWDKSNQKWLSQIKCNRKNYLLGFFDSEIESAMAYNLAAIKRNSEFYALNSIK